MRFLAGAHSKHRSIGDLETVLTLNDIKKACALTIFKSNQGPNVQNLVQLNLKKNIYCLFRSSHGKFDQDKEKDEAQLDIKGASQAASSSTTFPVAIT